jgi:alginate O-acetyltransferase complex protein AlgI
MLFSTNIFLYMFFPTVLALYFVAVAVAVKRKTITLGNLVLLCFSLLFYTWGSGIYVLLLLTQICANYIFGLAIDKFSPGKTILTVSVIFNLGLLVYFKYFDFILDTTGLGAMFMGAGFAESAGKILLPIGISFYTFQAMSYVIDVYSGRVMVQKNFLKLALYISFFPQLVAGPIVRYETIEKGLNSRKICFDDIYQGACRFCFGLGKKVLLADVYSVAVDKIFALQQPDMTMALAWTGMVLYSLQIYFDFSAYSDMAIGMARIFGFRYNENFLLPYISKNITEFWRRWHISLSTFFRDYLYIPLGGNRRGAKRTCLNLVIVFLLCGLWHGASWTFVIWGAYHGALLLLERMLLDRYNFRMKGILGQCAALLLIMFGWVIFRSPDISSTIAYFKTLFVLHPSVSFTYFTYWFYMNPQIIAMAFLGVIVSVGSFEKARDRFKKSTCPYGLAALIILAISMLYVSDASFNPFIYFQF